MESFSFSTSHFSIPTNTTLFSPKHHPSSSAATTPSFSLKPPPDSNNSAVPGNFRRPSNPLKTTSPNNSNPKTPSISNPLKNPFNSSQNSLTNKLWLTSKLSPPPLPPPPPPVPLPPPPPLEAEGENETANTDEKNETAKTTGNSDNWTQFRQPGKIFVGNLPLWVKKNEVSEFFRQFGPIKSVILIKGHHETERNAGFGFVIYGGGDEKTAEKSAMKAVEFDGVEFHGRVLTVKLDDGKRLKGKSVERARWLEGNDDKGEYHRTKWHEERDGSRKEFQKVLETEPENWQAVVTAFGRIKKVHHLNFKYKYAVYICLYQ